MPFKVFEPSTSCYPGKTACLVVLEVGAYQSDQVKNMMNVVGFIDTQIVKDLSGKDRLVASKFA